MGEVGRGSARRTGADCRREGASAARRPRGRLSGRHSRGCAAGAASSRAAAFPGGSRRHRRRSDRRPSARSGACAMSRGLGIESAVCPPEVLAKVGDLELVARIVVEGLVSGLHRSPFHGYSAEFSQYRRYRPGDDLKYVDWKLLARTDRVFTKQFRETTNMAASIVMDTSASMDFPPKTIGNTTKFRYGVIVAAALAHVIAGQGDAVGLVVRDEMLPARGGRQHLRRLLALLGSLAPGGGWSGPEIVRR